MQSQTKWLFLKGAFRVSLHSVVSVKTEWDTRQEGTPGKSENEREHPEANKARTKHHIAARVAYNFSTVMLRFDYDIDFFGGKKKDVEKD